MRFHSSTYFTVAICRQGCAYLCFVPLIGFLSPFFLNSFLLKAWNPWKSLTLKSLNLLLCQKLLLHLHRPLHLPSLRQYLLKNLKYFDNSEHPQQEVPPQQRRQRQHLSHTSFTHHLCHTPSLSHSILHTQLCHTQLCHAHTQIFTYKCLSDRSSTTSFIYPSFPIPLDPLFLEVDLWGHPVHDFFHRLQSASAFHLERWILYWCRQAFSIPRNYAHLTKRNLLPPGKPNQLTQMCLNYPKLSHTHVYPSRTIDDPHAGVGFAIPTPLLPIVYDFHPWNSAVLILSTRPHRVALFSIYAPSTHSSGSKTWSPTKTSILGTVALHL